MSQCYSVTVQCYLVLRPADETLAVVLTGEDDVEAGGGDGSLLAEHLSRPALELTCRQDREAQLVRAEGPPYRPSTR